MGFERHPVIYLFDPLPGGRREKLREDIRRHGCKVSVVLWNGQIIHGRHHAEICEELGLDVPTTTFCGTEAEAIEHSLSLSDERFFATDAQRALAGARLAKLLAGTGSIKGKVTQRAAELVGSKTRTVESAKAILDHATPELLLAVRDDTVSVSDAARVARLPASVQIDAVAAVKSRKAKTVAEAAEPFLAESRNGQGAEPGPLPADSARAEETGQLCRDLEALPGRLRRLAGHLDQSTPFGGTKRLDLLCQMLYDVRAQLSESSTTLV
jgi:hypothetical protein